MKTFEATFTFKVQVEAESRTDAKDKLKKFLGTDFHPAHTLQCSIQVHKELGGLCPYDSHCDDCTCEGMGGDR